MSDFSFILQAYTSAKVRLDYALNISDFGTNVARTAVNTPLSTSLSNGVVYSITNFISPLATNGQTVYVRLYIYNNSASSSEPFRLIFMNGGNVGPLFKGTVSSSSTTPVVTNDTAVTTINNDIDINILTNDDYSNQIGSINFSQPSHGTTVLNQDNTINYLPASGYTGSDYFTYSVTNNYGTSSTATVNISVNPATTSKLIQWDSQYTNYYPTSYEPSFISSSQPITSTGLTLGTDNWGGTVYKISNLPTPQQSTRVDTSKYIQFVLNNTSTKKTIEPKTFEYYAWGTGAGNYEIRYSKSSDFSNYKVLSSGTFSSTMETKSFNFDSITVEPTELLYIRLYLFNSYQSFYIKYNGGNIGPAINGQFYNYVYSPNETVWRVNPSTQLPYWDNGVPTATKNARIATYYNTSTPGRGNFESKNLTIDAGTGLVIASGDNITVNGRIINSGNDTNFIIEHDANLLQKTTDTNVGNVTVKKSAIIPKMGYNYWSSPVDGQNLYQFSNGYNQAIAANYDPNGTPWNRFYVYDEKTDYFKTSIPNEITLNSASTFEKARGYAIRGKNNFDVNITKSTQPANFEFVGVPYNGNISSYPLKWTDANHGFNMVGNPYPSNMDFEDFYELNKTKIKGIAYFWTNNDGKFVSQQSSNYGGNNYATINNGGGVSATYVGDTNKRPTGSISVGQGFIIQAIKGGKDQPLTFNNSLRTTSVASYYNKTTAQKNRFWLEFKSPTDVNNEILIGYINNATNGFDADYDADLLAIGSDSFWSILDNHKLAIQSKNPNFSKEDFTKIGYKASVAGNFKISLTERNGIFDSSQSVYLRDKQLNKVVDITNEPYEFFTNSGQYEDRLEVVYKPSETLGTNDNISKGIIVTKDNQNFVVRSPENLDEVSVYDAMGRLVYSSKANKKEILINKSNFTDGLYIVKAKSGNTITTKKVIK